MPECKPIKCPECVPLFRYFVNQQEALLNQNPTFTPDCPQGFTCEGQDIPYDNKVIPDVDPSDPDINPDCDYQCEADDPPPFNNSPKILVSNVAQSWSCQDEFPDSEVAGVRFCAAGEIAVNVGDPSEVADAFAQANAQALQVARARFLHAVSIGQISCYPAWVFETSEELFDGIPWSVRLPTIGSENNGLLLLELDGVTYGPESCQPAGTPSIAGNQICGTDFWYSREIGPFAFNAQLVADCTAQSDITLAGGPAEQATTYENTCAFYADGVFPHGIGGGFLCASPNKIAGSTQFCHGRTAYNWNPLGFGVQNASGQAMYVLPAGNKVWCRLRFRVYQPQHFTPNPWTGYSKVELTITQL